MNPKKFYEKAYSLLEDLTPIPADCGKLCESACCKSPDEEEAGMYLYYKEEVMLKNYPDIKIEETDFTYDGMSAKIAICDGTCDRHFRPLSCRIFPLVPYKKENSPLTIIIDPRAKAMCPLAKTFKMSDFDEDFIETVMYIFKVLSREKHIKSFIIEQSYLLDEYMEFLNP
mgnify:CR=1 FL=1